MRYDDYRNRVLKVARVFSWIRRHIVMLSVILITIACLIGATLALMGTVLWNQYPGNMIYGDVPAPQAIAWLSPVSFEYRTENGEWTSTVPKLTGNYQVRSVGTTLVGKPRYGAVGSFTIAPKAIEVKIDNGQVIYGETPNISAATAFNDRLVCEQFVYEDILQTQTTVTPIQSEIYVLSSENIDVTKAYEITVTGASVQILPRKITVTVEDTKIYDGISFSYGNYDITGGTLVNNDTLQATFNESLTDVGSIPNKPEFRILTKDAKDITHHYQIEENFGELTVEKRPLTILSGNLSAVYNGMEITNDSWVVSEATPLVSNHKLLIQKTASFTDVGSYQNNAIFKILDARGEDKTHNYSISVQESTIEILPKPIQVTTPSQEWEYDGMTHQASSLSVLGLVEEHTYKTLESASIQTVGTVSNTVRIEIYSDEINVSKNYDIQITLGSLTVTARSIVVCPKDVQEYYCGTPILGGEAVLTPDSPRQLVAGQYLVSTSTDSLTNVGTAVSSLETVKVMHNDQDVTDNYIIETRQGSITVVARPIRIEVLDAEKAYDGTPLTSTNCSAFPVAPLTDALAPDHRIDQIVTDGTQTEVGSTTNNLKSFVILDKDGTNQIENYDIISVEHGTLTVTKRPIKIIAHSAQKVYDGITLTAAGYDVLPVEPLTYALVTGHRIDNVVIQGSQTDAGSSENRLTDFEILDTSNANQIDNYDITIEHGTLTVTPRPIKIVVHSAQKVYDGITLTAAGYDLLPVKPLTYALVTGHRLDNVIIQGSQTDAGSSENRLLPGFAILDTKNANQTDNYDITIEHGTLTVTPRPIKIVVHSAQKVYDGTPLTATGYDLLPVKPLTYALVTGHRLDNVVIQGSQTDAGSSENRLTDFEILDTSNVSQIHNYDVIIEHGTLTVTKRPITVLSGSAEKIYDGIPLVCHDPIVITEGTLAPGHSLNMNATGKRTEVGTSDNTIGGEILDATKAAVTKNYEVTYSLGTLNVYGNDDTDNSIVFRVVSDKSEDVYFRLGSYGDYIGQDNWTDAPAYSKLLDGMYSYQYLTGIALKNAGYIPANIRIQSYTTSYPLPYYMAQGNYPYQIQTNDTASVGPALAEYSLGYYSYGGNGLDLVGYLNSYSDEELEYRSFVYDTYLGVDDETKAFMQEIIESEDWSLDDPTIIQKVAHYIKSAAVYDDRKIDLLDKETNMIIAFLNEYKEGVCRHYAAAATVLYRALGIPARYTVGFTAKTVADEWVDVGVIGHAWTEIYIDGVGWVPIEVTASQETGGGNSGAPQKEILNLKPSYQYKVYDGTPLVAINQLETSETLTRLLQRGYTYEVIIDGSQTEVGKGLSEIIEFRLYDSHHTDVTDQYIVVCEKGILEVLESETKFLHVYLHQLQKYYDGTELSFAPDDYEYDGLAPGHRLELDLKISLKDAGTISLSQINETREKYVEYRVFSGDVDVTHLYALIFEAPAGSSDSYVPIRIDRRPLELTANNVSKNDDGTPLEPQGATITLGSLAPGHELLPVSVIGSQSGIGNSLCHVDRTSIVILDQSGKNVTENYTISLRTGILEIYDPYS